MTGADSHGLDDAKDSLSRLDRRRKPKMYDKQTGGPMTSVVGEILPLAIGVAISPIPIIAAILMLLSPRAKSMSVAFLIGWIVGIVVAVAVFTLLSSVLPQ